MKSASPCYPQRTSVFPTMHVLISNAFHYFPKNQFPYFTTKSISLFHKMHFAISNIRPVSDQASLRSGIKKTEMLVIVNALSQTMLVQTRRSAPVSDLTWRERVSAISGGCSQVWCMHALQCRPSETRLMHFPQFASDIFIWTFKMYAFIQNLNADIDLYVS